MRTYSPGENFEDPALDRAGGFFFTATRGLLFFIAPSSVQNRATSIPCPLVHTPPSKRHHRRNGCGRVPSRL